MLVYGANTDMATLTVPSAKRGETAVYYFMFKNNMGKGSYLVSFWLMAEEATGVYRVDARESAVIIESNGDTSFNGLININAKYGRLISREETD